jgi:hypothetical protein
MRRRHESVAYHETGQAVAVVLGLKSTRRIVRIAGNVDAAHV